MLTEDASSFDPGLYVCGWLKRGPSGAALLGPALFAPSALHTLPANSAIAQPLPSPAVSNRSKTALTKTRAGIIGTNLVDAEQTVDTMVATQDSFRPVEAAQPGAEGLRALLQGRGVQVRGRGGGCWQARPRTLLQAVARSRFLLPCEHACLSCTRFADCGLQGLAAGGC